MSKVQNYVYAICVLFSVMSSGTVHASEVCATEVQVDKIEVTVTSCSETKPVTCELKFSLENTQSFASSTLCPISATAMESQLFLSATGDFYPAGKYVFEGVLVFAPNSDLFITEFDGSLTPKFY